MSKRNLEQINRLIEKSETEIRINKLKIEALEKEKSILESEPAQVPFRGLKCEETGVIN